MISEITLDVPQGVGDIAWVINKVSPHVETINLNILCIDKSVLQTRAQKFIERLKPVGKIAYKIVSAAAYNEVATTRYPLMPILDNPSVSHPYAVNRALEDGVRIEDIDPGMDVRWFLDYRVATPRIHSDEYVCLYVSGNKASQTWTPDIWINFVDAVCYQNNLRACPIMLIGAAYDEWVLAIISNGLRKRGYKTGCFVNSSVDHCIRYIRDAKLFIGYQSGLSIIADNYDVPQIMLYFPWLKPMLNTWCKRGHAESGMFRAFTFDQPVMEILKGCTEI